MNLHKFSDCRTWLKSLYDSHKTQNQSLTLAKFAMGLGLNASTLKMVLTGKRSLSLSQIPALAKKLSLTGDEVEILESMIMQEKAKNSSAKSHFSKKMKLAQKKLKISTRVLSQKSLLADPLTLPVLVYLTDILFRDSMLSSSSSTDPSVVSSVSAMFKISNLRAKSILENINKQDALQREENEESIHYSYSRVHNTLQQKEYIKEWVRISEKSVDPLYERPETVFNSSTLSMTQEQLASFKTDLKELLEKYMSLRASSEEEIQIVQANFQVYPLT